MDSVTDSLTASGGVVPAPVVYDLFPTFKVNRGGIKYGDSLLSKKDQRFLDMASGVALTSSCKKRHGALIVRHSKILGASPNIEKNNPKFVDWNFSSVHAEIRAMQRAGWPTKATCYVARVNNQGKNRLSQPCASCQAVLDDHKIRVIYTESDLVV